MINEVSKFYIKTVLVLLTFPFATGSPMAQNSSVGPMMSPLTKHAIYLHREERDKGTPYANSQNILQQNMDMEEILFGE